MKKIAVVLSGCGFKDGAEITEATSTLISLSSHPNVTYKVFAPNVEFQATDHMTDDTTEKRNVMTESARISRGEISSLDQLKESDFDGIAFPGGFGAALHLCDWAQKGFQCSVHPEAQRVVEEFYEAGKPITAICIAPALIAKVLGSHGVTVTIGNDAQTSSEIEKTGARHENCAVDDFVTDRENKVITTPAYMYDAKPFEVYTGVNKAIKELVEMA